MAVAKEQFEQSAIRVTGPHMPKVERVTRQSNGDWAFQFRIIGEAELPDGRLVEIHKRVSVRANCQVGRRRPAMFVAAI